MAEVTIPQRLIGLDPGDPHVGVALWELQGERWKCVRAKEMTPTECIDYLQRALNTGTVQTVAYEIFRLTGGREAAQQTGSTFPTVELIGSVRTLCRWHGVVMKGFERGVRRATRKRMEHVGWRFPRGCANHVRDAIAIGATATSWTAKDHFDGDGCGDSEPQT